MNSSTGAGLALAAGTLFFSLFGIHTGKDLFLMVGLVACVLGDGAFAAFLLEHGAPGSYEETLATGFGVLALVAVYAIWRQLLLWREEGCGTEEEFEEGDDGALEDAPPATAAVPDTPTREKKAPDSPRTPAASSVEELVNGAHRDAKVDGLRARKGKGGARA